MSASQSGRTEPAAKDPPPSSLAIVRPAEPSAVAALRRAAIDLAAAHGAAPETLADVALAASEAATNAVKHAHVPGETAVVELTATVADGWLEIWIRDRGRGFGSGPSDGLGLGLIIIASVAVHLTICQEGDGTEVRMRFPLDPQLHSV